MKMYTYAIISLLLLLLSATYVNASSAYIYVPAVTGVTTSTLTKIQLNVTTGNGAVIISGPTNVSADTYQSAKTAVYVGSNYVGLNMGNYNFTFTIFDNASDVSGPSGGFAMTLLTISALLNRSLVHNFSATGTISRDGSVGQIGGVYDKAGAVKNGGMRFFLVPAAAPGSEEDLIYYMSQQHYNLPMMEMSNVSQGVKYAFGIIAPSSLTFNFSDNKTIADAPLFNQTCTNCTLNQFGKLENDTLNYTTGELNNLTGNYSAFKSEALAELYNYSLLAKKGYLYAAANLAFTQYSNIFVLVNQKSLSQSGAGLLINSVNNFCSSVTPPLMTNTNYEYVVGGEMRQTWANITLNDSTAALAQVQTSDEIAGVLHQVGSAYAWCLAASDMYNIAANMTNASSTYVQISKAAQSQILAQVQSSTNLPSSLYTNAALQDYKLGWYPAALYNAEYANAFDNSTIFGTYNNSQLIDLTNANVANSIYGVWPYEFGAEAKFYLSQVKGSPNSNASTPIIQNAYTVSFLSSALSGANRLLSSSFQVVNASSLGITKSIANIQTQVSQIYAFLAIIVFLLFVIFLLLLLILIKQHAIHNSVVGKQRTRSAARARRR